MIHIRILRGPDGVDMTAVGHAGQGPRGRDPVCAGVSALLYGWIAYLETLPPIATAEEGGEDPHLVCSEGEGRLRVTTRGLGGADIRSLAVIEAGLRLIQAAYPAAVTLCDPPTDRPREKGECNERNSS